MCMYTYIHTYIYIYIHVYLYIYVYMYVYIYMYIYIYTYIYIYLSISLSPYIYIYREREIDRYQHARGAAWRAARSLNVLATTFRHYTTNSKHQWRKLLTIINTILLIIPNKSITTSSANTHAHYTNKPTTNNNTSLKGPRITVRMVLLRTSTVIGYYLI